jgi:hypothetical protein
MDLPETMAEGEGNEAGKERSVLPAPQPSVQLRKSGSQRGLTSKLTSSKPGTPG